MSKPPVPDKLIGDGVVVTVKFPLAGLYKNGQWEAVVLDDFFPGQRFLSAPLGKFVGDIPRKAGSGFNENVVKVRQQAVHFPKLVPSTVWAFSVQSDFDGGIRHQKIQCHDKNSAIFTFSDLTRRTQIFSKYRNFKSRL